MPRTKTGLSLVAIATLALGACGSDDTKSADTAPATTVGSSTPAASGATLTISGLAFGSVTPTAGEPITIVNDDPFGHTVTDRDGRFNVKVAGGSSASLTIDEPGTYKIFCEIHSDMAREIVVS